jgi:UrcA family protein
MKTIIIGAALASAPLAVPALAQAPAQTETLVINTAGLNLATPAGQQALSHRVDAAIEKLCSAQVFATIDYDAMDECRAAVRAEVEPQLKAAAPAGAIIALR